MTTSPAWDEWAPWFARRAHELSAAILFLTRLPLPRHAPEDGAVARGAWAFPLAGFVVGLIARGGLCDRARFGAVSLAGGGAGDRRDADRHRLPARGRARRHRRWLRRRRHARAQARHHARQPDRHLRRLCARDLAADSRRRHREPERDRPGGGGFDRGAFRRARGDGGGDVLSAAGAQRRPVVHRRPAVGGARGFGRGHRLSDRAVLSRPGARGGRRDRGGDRGRAVGMARRCGRSAARPATCSAPSSR